MLNPCFPGYTIDSIVADLVNYYDTPGSKNKQLTDLDDSIYNVYFKEFRSNRETGDEGDSGGDDKNHNGGGCRDIFHGCRGQDEGHLVVNLETAGVQMMTLWTQWRDSRHRFHSQLPNARDARSTVRCFLRLLSK